MTGNGTPLEHIARATDLLDQAQAIGKERIAMIDAAIAPAPDTPPRPELVCETCRHYLERIKNNDPEIYCPYRCDGVFPDTEACESYSPTIPPRAEPVDLTAFEGMTPGPWRLTLSDREKAEATGRAILMLRYERSIGGRIRRQGVQA